MSYQATGTCEHCGWAASAEADDLVTLRFELDVVLGGHACCRTCKQPIVDHDGAWWHAATGASPLSREADPWGADLDLDHEPEPAHSDGQADG